jgi:hypothetical protein
MLTNYRIEGALVGALVGSFWLAACRDHGCEDDTDCKGARICVAGECVADGSSTTPQLDDDDDDDDDDGPEDDGLEDEETSEIDPDVDDGEEDGNGSEADGDDGADTSADGSVGPSCTLAGDSHAGAGGCYPIDANLSAWLDGLEGFWSTDPTWVCVYDGVVNGACGAVGPTAAYCPLDDSIVLETGLLDYVAQSHPYGPVVILAHEWGHKNQAVLGYTGGNKLMELHADCMGGLFSGAYDLELGGTTLLDAGLGTSCMGGDPMASPWWEPGAHGTCAERQCAFQEGWSAGQEEGVCSLPIADAVCASAAQACSLG